MSVIDILYSESGTPRIRVPGSGNPSGKQRSKTTTKRLQFMPKNFIMVDIFQECLLLSKIPGKRRISAADMTGWYAKNEGGRFYGRKQTRGSHLYPA